jgi:hypothetical protein
MKMKPRMTVEAHNMEGLYVEKWKQIITLMRIRIRICIKVMSDPDQHQKRIQIHIKIIRIRIHNPG